MAEVATASHVQVFSMAVSSPSLRKRVAEAMSKLADCGVRMTPQRAAILEYVFSASGHFSADDLWYGMRAEGRRVSRATVYRFLNVLLKAGVLREVPLGDVHVHYELAAGRRHHEHLICTGCGQVVEFDRPEIPAAVEEVCRQHGFECRDYSFEVLGLCPRCAAPETADDTTGCPDEEG